MTSAGRLIVFCLFVLGLSLTGAAGESARIVRPLRQLELVTGERLIVEFLRLDEQGCEFRWHGHTRCRLPLAAIRSLANPPGVIDHWEESFDKKVLDATAPTGDVGAWHSHRDQSRQYTVESPIAAGELLLWYHSLGPHKASSANVLHCHFKVAENAVDLALKMNDDGSLSCAAPPIWRKTFTQPLRTSSDWTRLAVRWNADRCEVVVGDAIHTLFATEDAAFTGLTLEPGDPVTTAGVLIDNVVLREFNADIAKQPLPPRVEDQDAVTLTTGDQLFGRFVDASRSDHMALRSPQGDWSGDWRHILRLDFARRPLPAHFYAPVCGWCFDVRTSPQDARQGLTESLRGVRFSGRAMVHPWLGQVAWLPSPQMVIIPYGWGELRWLDPDRQHLGDEIRSDLSPVLPVGTSITGEVHLDSRPHGTAWMVLDVAELEPSGPGTLPTQPFLDRLRGGGLRTELVINDHIITDLNRLVSIRAAALSPDRVWVPIPRNVWQDGQNIWKLRQQPLSPKQAQYDDCEVSHAALWIPCWPW